MRGANDGIWDWDLTSNEIYFSRRWKEMLGYADDELEIALSIGAISCTLTISGAFSIWADYMEGEREQFEIEYRLKRKDGNYAWIHCRGLASRAQDGGSVRLTGSHTDISQRIEALEELKAEKAEERRLLDKLQLAQDELILSEERLRISLVLPILARWTGMLIPE
ncbi:PAS domain-containing protein [Candidatus Reidiella endopervernicosa]|uniref:PAS domain-containing protein n=1 Tax=Candidatus Reidiella endopervernicosa TaxID=2738883 RepID=UPI001F415A9E|nr:PAS domain-containing protein [Candidatus Reidiella endopervernicosa]